MKEKKGNMKGAYELSNGCAEVVKDHYANWASDYDRDTESFGYVGPKQAAEVLARYLSDKNASILDIGCGTGLVGVLCQILNSSRHR